MTTYLRQIWKDNAALADFHHKVIAGEVSGDRQKAIEITNRINAKYLEGDADGPDGLVEAFQSMKVDS